ncbi:lipid binding protein [Clavulina sp. PMI_390]|nr:lipid binding protein [Clavulina sp. PMI_390]
MSNDEVFDSVLWDTPTTSAGGGYDASRAQPSYTTPSSGPLGYRQDSTSTTDNGQPKWEGYLEVEVKDPVKELEHTKDAYVSYLVVGRTNLSTFSTNNPQSRRRFTDFVFLRDSLANDFPACVVPPLPGKHRLEYITGDRFSPEFVEHRREGLQLFLQRIARHPTLQRATLVNAFFESTEWSVTMHKHTAHPPGPDPPASILDSISDTWINTFSKVRKPDERFLEVKEGIDRFEEGVTSVERGWGRIRARTIFAVFHIGVLDLSADYRDMALAVQGLGFLESGITDPLNQFSNTLLEFSTLLKSNTTDTSDPFLSHLHTLLAYSQTHRDVLKLRDQKQMDLEDLSSRLGKLVIERDRLSSLARGGRPGGGTSGGLGLTGYLRDRMESLTGRAVDDDQTRYERMRKLDGKIKTMQDEVSTAAETSDAFSDETLKEYLIFQHEKQAEMKDALGAVVDGQIEMYRKAMEEWDKLIPVIERIRVDV